MKQICHSLDNVSAVYCITNTVNGKKYIGSSSNLYSRLLKHRALLRHGSHGNVELQNDWDRFGEDSFDYEVVEECPENNLKIREDYYIKNSKDIYNSAIGTIGFTFRNETRNRMSTSRKSGFKNGTITPYQLRKVSKYDLDGNFIVEYDSLKEAAKTEGIHVSSIIRCANGTYSQNNGFRWSYERKDNIGPYEAPKNIKPNKYIYIVKDGDNELRFDGCKACAEYFGVSTTSVEQVIHNGNIYRKKYTITKICRSHE